MAFWDRMTGRKTEELGAPVSGEAIALRAVKDQVFSAQMLGKGVAVIPDGQRVAAPCRGKIETVFETGHALTMTTDGGVQVLIHIGIDTVKLGGKHFRALCRDGQRVEKGQALIEFERSAIEQAGYDATVVMVLPEGSNIAKSVTGRHVAEGETVIRLALR